jgi:hypothetical protein
MDLMQPPYQESGALIERPGRFGSSRAFSGHQSLPGRGRLRRRLHEFDAVYGTNVAVRKYDDNTKHASQLTDGQNPLTIRRGDRPCL